MYYCIDALNEYCISRCRVHTGQLRNPFGSEDTLKLIIIKKRKDFLYYSWICKAENVLLTLCIQIPWIFYDYSKRWSNLEIISYCPYDNPVVWTYGKHNSTFSVAPSLWISYLSLVGKKYRKVAGQLKQREKKLNGAKG